MKKKGSGRPAAPRMESSSTTTIREAGPVATTTGETARASPATDTERSSTPAVETTASAGAPRTVTLDGSQRLALSLAPREPVTSLRYVGRDREPLPLPAAKRRFSIGAGECDLVIPREESVGVSGFHALLVRAGGGLLVRDQGSKNGTFRSPTEPRSESIQVHAGEMFWLGDVALQAMDSQLEVLRPEVAMRIGLDSTATVDKAMRVIAAGGPLALVGPKGMGARRLAEAIHQASPQRNHFCLAVERAPLPAIDRAAGGTVFVDLDAVGVLPAPYAAALFDPANGLRTIFSVRAEPTLRKRLDTYRDPIATISLMPLAARRDEIVRLLAMLWIQELATTRRVEELGRGRNALAAHRWARNLDELREQAPRLLAYLEHGALRPAAAALGITHQSLSGHLKRIGFPMRDRSER